MAPLTFAVVAASTIIAAVSATSNDSSATASALTFQQRGLCLAAGAAKPRERTPLVLSACSTPATLDAWLVGTDPLGHPQIASAVEPGLCINDDSVNCTVGNDVYLYECQGNSTFLHKANHFSFVAGKIVAEFCKGLDSDSVAPTMCLVAPPADAAVPGRRLTLGLCSTPEATWAQKIVPAPKPMPPPPGPSPAPPIPPPFPAPQPPFGPFAPPFPPTWSLAGSTVIQAGRKDNWMNASAAAKYGILSIDWANYRRGWDPKTHALPANDGCMVDQAQQIKAQGTTTKVYVYRNAQQALAIESSCYAVMSDERYAGLFLRCKDGSIYHRGASAKTGECKGPLNGTDPWAIFFWDFRNKSAQTYFLDSVVGGPNGIGSQYVDGVFLDDAGPGTRTAPMFEYRNQLRSAAAHIGMSDEEIVELSNATHEMLVNLRTVLYQKGKGVWLSSGDPSWFHEFDSHCTGNQTMCNWWSAPTAGETCTQFYASLCRQDLNGSGFTYNPNSHHHPWPLPEELGWHLAVGTFLLLRGELAWLMTSSWFDGRHMLWDPSLDLEVGEPTGTCAQEGSVFSRTWSRGRVKIDCKDLSVQLDFASLNLKTDDDVDSRDVDLPLMELDGEWTFALLPDNLPVPTDYHSAQAYVQASNSSIHVPGSWDAQGFGNETDRMRHEWLGRGAYQRRVKLPAKLTKALARDGARAWLVIQRPKRSVEVFAASKLIGSHLGYLDNLELDVTDYLHGSDPAIFDCMLIVDGGWGNVNVPPLGTCPWVGTSEAPACKLPAAGPAQAGAPNDRDQMVGVDCAALRDGSPGDWGGFHGHIHLVVRNRVGLSAPESLQITTPGVPPDGRVGVHVTPTNGSQTYPGDSASFTIRKAGSDSVVARGIAVTSADGTFNITASVSAESLVLWDLETPQLYVATVTIQDQSGHALAEVNESFGFRSFSTSGMSFLLNGEPIFLSGYGDDNIFPLTYAPPTERTWYDKKFRLAKQLGFTFVRYHSHFLPDECYAAADAVGMLLQASLPVEYSRFYFEPPMHGGDGPGVGTAAGHALLQRTWNASVVRVRNHPSVVSFSMGNEAYYVAPGTPREQNRTWDDATTKFSWARQLAPHQLIVDTDGVVPSAERGRATLDYYAADFNVGSDMVEDPRKYDAYAPYDYDRPMIAHEFGNWNAFPMVERLVALFNTSSVVKPYWLLPTLARLKAQGLEQEQEHWARMSGRLMRETAKREVEALRASGHLAGFQWWLLQDFWTGSNGVFDSFLNIKPGISDEPAELRTFLSQTVLLCEEPLPAAMRGGQSVNTTLKLSAYTSVAVGATVSWSVEITGGILVNGTDHLGSRPLPRGQVSNLTKISFALPAGLLGSYPLGTATTAARLKLSAQIRGASGELIASNYWTTRVYPTFSIGPSSEHNLTLYTSTDLEHACMFSDCQALPDSSATSLPPGSVILLSGATIPAVATELVRKGATLLFVQTLAGKPFPSAATRFKSAWWLGSATDNNCGSVVYSSAASILSGMAEDGYLDYSWHSLVNKCQTILMEDLANGTQQYQVMVRALDIAGTGSRSKALLFRYALGQGTVMVTGLNVLQNLTNRGEINHTAHTGGCPSDFPFPINPNSKNGNTGANMVCYKTQSEAHAGTGPCGSWCTKSLDIGSGCGDNQQHLCSGGYRPDALWLLFQMIRQAAAGGLNVAE